MKKNNLVNQTAIVCGASKGIGAATAIELSKCGASTILLARNKKDLNQIISQLDTNQKQTHSFIIADFQNPVSLKKRLHHF